MESAEERLAGSIGDAVGDQLELFPVNFVTQNGTVLFRTAEGTKLFSTVANDKVLFEADDHTVADGWSVIIRGTARCSPPPRTSHEAERAQLLPWVPTEKLRFVRITPSEVSGRRFQFGPEPEHGSYPARTAHRHLTAGTRPQTQRQPCRCLSRLVASRLTVSANRSIKNSTEP